MRVARREGGIFNHDLTHLDYQTLSQREKRSLDEIEQYEELNSDWPSGIAVAPETKRCVEPGPEVFLSANGRLLPRNLSGEVALIGQTKGVGKKRTKCGYPQTALLGERKRLNGRRILACDERSNPMDVVNHSRRIVGDISGFLLRIVAAKRPQWRTS